MGERSTTRPAVVRSRHDPALVARVIERVPLLYAQPPDVSLDRPAHVRAASGVVWLGDSLAVVQDDANFLALVDPGTGLASAIPLPADAFGRRQFDEGRGNKADKLDLEALVAVHDGDETVLLAIGSGSAPRREHMVMVRHARHPAGTPEASRALAEPSRAYRVTGLPVPALYARLRREPAFAGSDLNIEGALHLGDQLRLFGRGNGVPRDGALPLNATCDLDWTILAAHLESREGRELPEPRNVFQYHLGSIDGVDFGFTDAAAGPESAARQMRDTIYAAAAEASPDARRDGAVAGSALGVLREVEGAVDARWAVLLDERGLAYRAKVEGVTMDRENPGHAFVVVDADAHDEPALLCRVELGGPWFAPG